MGRCLHTFYTSAVQPVPTLICRLYKHLHTLRFDPSPSQRSFSNLLDSINENVQHLRPSMGLVFRILVFSCTWGRFWSLGSVGSATWPRVLDVGGLPLGTFTFTARYPIYAQSP